MRWIWTVCLALAVSAAWAGRPEAKEVPAITPAEVAEWIRSGIDKRLDHAANRASVMSVQELRELFREIRDQTRIDSVLHKKRIKNLTWEQATLDTAVAYLQTITGVNYYITPKVRAEKLEDIVISLKIDDVTVHHLLDLITEPYGLAWRIRQGVVFVATTEEVRPGESPKPVASDAAVALRKKVDATRVNVSVADQSFGDVVKMLQIMTGINILIDPRIAHEVSQAPVTAVKLVDAPLTAALTLLVGQAGDESVCWTVQGNVILITSKEFLKK